MWSQTSVTTLRCRDQEADGEKAAHMSSVSFGHFRAAHCYYFYTDINEDAIVRDFTDRNLSMLENIQLDIWFECFIVYFQRRGYINRIIDGIYFQK